MNTLTVENYLKAMYYLSEEKGEVNVTELSKQLAVKMPTITSMMKKLAAKKLVDYQSYKPLKLTDKGKKLAIEIIRKHRLTEMFLVEKMGIGWEQVHEIAEQMEHIQSPIFFEKMDELLNYPKFDPHGSPIPDKNGVLNKLTFKKLSECKENEIVNLKAINNNSSDFLSYLNKKELIIGTEIKIISIESFDKSMVVKYGNFSETTLTHTVCERLLVE